MGFFEIGQRPKFVIAKGRGVSIDGASTKRGPVGPRGPAGLGSDGAVQVAMSQQAGTAMRVGVNAGTVGLLVIADSKGAGTGLTNFADRWQNRLAALMRARFPIAGGDTMRGLIPANMSDPYNAMSGRPTTTGTTYPVDTAGLGYNTLQLELGSVLTFPAATWPAGTHTLPIGYHTHSGANGTLQVLIDGVVQTEIDCAGAGEGEPKRTSIPVTAGTHTVSMRPKTGTAPVRVMYAEQRSASTGWHLYDATRPGLAARHVVAGPPGAAQGDESFAAAVAQLPGVRLAVVALGANDMTISTPAQYGQDMRAVVDMVKAGHPTAGVVVVLPAALTDDSAVVDDVQAYHTAARSALVDVPDLSIVAETQLVDLTGPNAGAWLADSVHPNAFGHDLISRALAGSLVGLDGPTDALTMVEAAAAPAVADAQAAQTSAAQSAADADASRVLAEQAQAAALEVPDANTAAMIGNPATDTRQALDAGWTVKAKSVAGGQQPAPLRVPTLSAIDSWPNAASPRGRLVMHADQGRTLYVMGMDKSLYKSTDSGSTWEHRSYFAAGSVGGHVNFLRTPTGTILYYAYNRAVHRSTDDGATFATVATLAVAPLGSQSWCVDKSNGHIYLAEYTVGSESVCNLWRSTDDGATWSVFHAFPTVVSGSTSPDTIRHIHAVQWDPHGQTVWICAGDGSPNTGLWRVNAAKTGVEAMVTNVMLPSGSWEKGGFFDAPRSIGIMPFPDYIAWASDSTSNPGLFRVHRSQLGSPSPTVERIYRTNSTNWFTAMASADGSRWVFCSSQEGPSRRLDQDVHLYAVEDQGATVYEVGSLPMLDDTRPGGSLMPIGPPEEHGRNFFLTTREVGGIAGADGLTPSWRFRLVNHGAGAEICLPPALTRPPQWVTASSGTRTVAIGGREVFLASPTPQISGALYIFETNKNETGSVGRLHVEAVDRDAATVLYTSQHSSARNLTRREWSPYIARIPVAAGRVIEFVLRNAHTGEVATGSGTVVYGWGR